MKNLKLYTILFLLFSCLLFTLFGCKKSMDLSPFVSELKTQIYSSESEEFKLTASYGFKEKHYNSDGKISERVYVLAFRLLDKQSDNVSYSLLFDYNGVNYKTNFKLNPVSHVLLAVIEIENFNEKEFTVTLAFSSKSVNLAMKSCVPDQTITYQNALSILQKNQPELIKLYLNENNIFCGEIILRILIKESHSYWYVGLCDKDGNLKALLLDGFTGEVLAIRQIF